jgi:hypothetical protein
VNGTGLGLCPVVGFGIHSIKPLGSFTRVLVTVLRQKC